MPTSCCVPECTKKGYLHENGRNVSHFKFPDDPLRRKKSIHAIRRDEGVYFQIQEWTKVCSRHFREYDFIKTLSGRRDLRSNAVTSLFPWTRTFFRTISPGGGITFISQLYTGSISDREIVVRSGLLDLPFQEKDSIMADSKCQQMMQFALKKLPVYAYMLSEQLTK